MQSPETPGADPRARSVASALAVITGVFALGGCQVVKDIFGGGIAVVTRK